MTREELIKDFGNRLKPIYKDMIPAFESNFPMFIQKGLLPEDAKTIDQYYFISCPQWGKYYPIDNSNEGILFYGRATNGWGECYDPEEVFTPPYMDLFRDDVRMKWVFENSNGKLPIVRVMKAVSEYFYSSEWNQHISYSNICKITTWRDGLEKLGYYRSSPNPCEEEYDAQYAAIIKLLDVELKFFSPKVVIFITGATSGEKWDGGLFDIARYRGIKYKEQNSIVWGHRYNVPLSVQYCMYDNTLFIRCDRPEGNGSWPQKESEAIIKLIKDNIPF